MAMLMLPTIVHIITIDHMNHNDDSRILLVHKLLFSDATLWKYYSTINFALPYFNLVHKIILTAMKKIVNKVLTAMKKM